MLVASTSIAEPRDTMQAPRQTPTQPAFPPQLAGVTTLREHHPQPAQSSLAGAGASTRPSQTHAVAAPRVEREEPIEDWKVVAILGGTAIGGLATFVFGAIGISALF